MPSPVTGFDAEERTYGGHCRVVHRRGSGPAVVVLSEVPGITPRVADFARRVAALGCTAVVAPVLSQPSLPLPVGAARRRDLGVGDDDLEQVRQRVAEGTCVLGLRFTGDRACPVERFARLAEELGDGFVAVELDSSPGNPAGHRRNAHSVLTEDLDDRPGTPTRQALDRVLDFLGERLLA